MKKETIVVFDEAHNIDDACIEAFTVKVTNRIYKLIYVIKIKL
jgi:Rad3-related DNA helicase